MKKCRLFFLLFLAGHMCYQATAGEIIQIDASSRHLVPKGKSPDAIDGDWIMKNDKVIAVIGSAVKGREANMRAQNIQGAVIDFTSLADNNDYLVTYYPHGIPGPDSRSNPVMFAHRIVVVKSNGPQIVLRAVRDADDNSPYQVITEYVLRDGDNFLGVTTTYINTSSKKVLVNVTDNMRIDQDITDASPVGEHALAFIYNKWFDAAYGIYNEDGLLVPTAPKTGHEPGVGLSILPASRRVATDTAGNVSLKPRQRITLKRYLLYGKDVATIQQTTLAMSKKKLPFTTFTVTDNSQKPIEKVFLEILNNRKEIVSFGITNAQGKVLAPLPPGSYFLQASKVGHDTLQKAFSLAGAGEHVTGTLAPQTSILFNVKENGSGRRLPYKIEFKGLHQTPDPYLGTMKRAEGANNFYYAINKAETRVPIAPGHYLVILSHGPEYKTIYTTITVSRGETKTISAELERLFDTPQWIIADLHNHTTISGDNDSHTKSRIINFAGAGIEFAPATEHNRLVSYTDDIKTLGLEEYVSSAAGIELTGPPGKSPNHENAFPLRIQEGLQGNGFPGIDPDPYVQLEQLYNYDAGQFKFIQHNHPTISNLYFDKNSDGVIDGGYGTRKFTHAIEIQELMFEALSSTAGNATTKEKNNRFFQWLQMLNQGDRIFGTTTSDAHYVGPSSGARFVYMYTQNDKPLTIDPVDIARSAKNGHIIMTNGPFLDVSINGYRPGEEIQSNGNLQMNIRVLTNNELEIDRVQLLINGKQDPQFNFTRASHPGLFNQYPLQFSHSFSLLLDKDAHVIVVATGNRIEPKEPLNKPLNEKPPVAISNPFFVDIDWDGFKPNKDTLGEPLPVVKRAEK